MGRPLCTTGQSADWTSRPPPVILSEVFVILSEVFVILSEVFVILSEVFVILSEAKEL
jgi:hypothetical protein